MEQRLNFYNNFAPLFPVSQ